MRVDVRGISDPAAAWARMDDQQRRAFGSFRAFAEHRRLSSGGPAASGGNRGGTRRAGAADLTALKRQWESNAPTERGVPLQDEFGGDYDAFVAYCKHEAAGDITICAAGAQAVRPPRKAARPSRAYTAADERRDRATFARNEQLQREFDGDPEAFVAYCKHRRQGDITVFSQHSLRTGGEQCGQCQYAGAGNVCSAFPEGVPDGIRSGVEPCPKFEPVGTEQDLGA